MRESCFTTRDSEDHGTHYLDFSQAVKERREIANHVDTFAGVKYRQTAFLNDLSAWWNEHFSIVEALAPDVENQTATSRNVYDVRAALLESIEHKFTGQHLLTRYQVRGAFANFWKQLASDFKSIAASGWGPELIPDEDILQSQFPEVLSELEQQRSRLAELQALFAAANEEDFEDSDETGVLPADEVKALKDELKENTAAWKDQLKVLKGAVADFYVEIKVANKLPAGSNKSYYCTEGLSANNVQFANGQRILELAKSVTHISAVEATIQLAMTSGQQAKNNADKAEEKLITHKALEDEMKSLKTAIKSTEAKKYELVEKARLKISKDQARVIIVERVGGVLFDCYLQFLKADQRACVATIENLWNKYAITAKQVEDQRNQASKTLKTFLIELGYE